MLLSPEGGLAIGYKGYFYRTVPFLTHFSSSVKISKFLTDAKINVKNLDKN